MVSFAFMRRLKVPDVMELPKLVICITIARNLAWDFAVNIVAPAILGCPTLFFRKCRENLASSGVTKSPSANNVAGGVCDLANSLQFAVVTGSAFRRVPRSLSLPVGCQRQLPSDSNAVLYYFVQFVQNLEFFHFPKLEKFLNPGLIRGQKKSSVARDLSLLRSLPPNRVRNQPPFLRVLLLLLRPSTEPPAPLPPCTDLFHPHSMARLPPRPAPLPGRGTPLGQGRWSLLASTVSFLAKAQQPILPFVSMLALSTTLPRPKPLTAP